MEFSYYFLLEIHTRRFRTNLILVRFRLMCTLHEVLLHFVSLVWKVAHNTSYFLHINILPYSMKQSPSWQANRFSASQEILRILRNSMVHYRSYKCPPPVPILSQLDTVHSPKSHFLKIHLSIILPSTPGSPRWSLSFRFSHKNPVYTSPLPHTRYTPRLSHSSRFYHPNNIGWGVRSIKLLIM